ncbi:MAG TPA: helix-turn-helix domain-containing protein, partial [Pyrinomonadaceae bacterium]|nr:helix-turn-helix domain-containing protein [Pyrinomonadaceae bacterium]
INSSHAHKKIRNETGIAVANRVRKMATTLTALESQSPPPLLNVSELAAFLKVKPRTIYEMVAQNRIPYRKPPGSNILRFDLDEIIAWTKARNNK